MMLCAVFRLPVPGSPEPWGVVWDQRELVHPICFDSFVIRKGLDLSRKHCDVLKIPVNRCKPYVSYAIDLPQSSNCHLTNHSAVNLGLSTTVKSTFQVHHYFA